MKKNKLIKNMTKSLILIVLSIMVISIISTFIKYTFLNINNKSISTKYKKEIGLFYYSNPYKIIDNTKWYEVVKNINRIKKAKSNKYSDKETEIISNYLSNQYTLLSELSKIEDGSSNKIEYLNKIAYEKKIFDKYYDYSKYEKVIKIIKNKEIVDSINEFNLYNNITSSYNINNDFIDELITPNINIISIDSIIKYYNINDYYLISKSFSKQRINMFYELTSDILKEVIGDE